MKFFKEKRTPWFLRARPRADRPAAEIETAVAEAKTAEIEKPIQGDQGNQGDKGLTDRAELIFRWVLYLTLFLLPFYFLPPIFKNFNFYFWRDFLFLSLTLLLVFFFTLKLLFTQKFSLLKQNTFNLLLVVASLVFLVTIFFSESRLISLTNLATWTYAGWLAVLFVLANNLREIGEIREIGGIREKIGKGLIGVSLLLVLLAWVLPFSLWFDKLPAPFSNYLQKPALLDLRTSWNIAIDSFKNSPLTGFGPGLYNQAFQVYKPIFYNQTQNFNQLFSTTPWPFLGTLTTQGILAVFLWVMVLVALARLIVNKPYETYTTNISLEAARVASAVLLAFLIVAGALLFKLYSAESLYQKALFQLSQNQGGQALQTLQAAINQNPYNTVYRRTLTVLGFALANSIAADPQSKDDKGQLVATAQSDVQALIDLSTNQARTITENLDPLDARNWLVRGDVYQGLMSVAQGAADWALSAYQQAVQLGPTDPNLRIALGGIYLTLGRSYKISSQNIADAIAAGKPITFNNQELSSDEAKNLQKQQAEQGQSFLEQAAEQFRMAVIVKPDLANAYYNWAAALRELDKNNQAQAALQQTLALVEKDSPDYEQVKKDLDNIQEKLGIKVKTEEEIEGGREIPQPTGEINVPTKLPTPAPTPQ